MSRVLACGAVVADPGDAPGSLITLPRQLEFGGLLMGSGTPYRWKKLDGWDAMPGLDLSDTPRAAGHGDWSGMGLFQSRMPSFTLTIRGDTPALMEEAIRAFNAALAYSDDDQPLVVRDTGRTLVGYARAVARDVTHSPDRTLGVLDASTQWKCSDPRRYGPTLHTAQLVPGGASGGVVYPLAYPVDYGPVQAGNIAVLSNDGDADASPQITITGPATTVRLGSDRAGALKIVEPLTAADTLTVDTRDGSILLNGTADRTGSTAGDSVPAEEWALPPGSTTVALIVDGAGPNTSATVTWQDTNW